MSLKKVEFETLKGKVFTKIEVSAEMDEISFMCNDGSKYKMYHEQECCESVYIEDINGVLRKLIGKPILIADEATNRNTGPKRESSEESYTWTFYRLANINTWVVIRWYGTSNGCYAESVELVELKGAEVAEVEHKLEVR